MKLRVSLGIGLAGTYRYREDVLTIPEEELAGMSNEEKEAYIDEVYIQEWANNYIDVGYEEVED